MKIAVLGCAHGEIEEIINAIERFENDKDCKIDLLICCGDFQAIRNENDLSCMACPVKYRKLNTFYKYYSGELIVPFPVICIGGNHESSNYFYELYHGGWLAPNIYFLGTTGSIIFGGLRICGISGIFKQHDFNIGQFETLPLSKNEMYSIYHTRKYNIWKLSQLHGNNIDIFLSHDWPSCVWKYGNWYQLIKFKQHFASDCVNDKLGNPALNHLLFQLQPKQWFSGHLHCRYSAIINHKDTQNITRFLATDKFDKSNKRRTFIQVLDFQHPENVIKNEKTGFYKFEYDPIWLAIIKSTNPFMSVTKHTIPLPSINNNLGIRWDYRPNKKEIDDIINRFNGDLTIPNNFIKTASIPNNPNDENLKYQGKPPPFICNPQTKYLMDKLGIIDKLTEKHKSLSSFNNNNNNNGIPYMFNNNNNDDDDEIFKWIESKPKNINKKRIRETQTNDPNEIDLNDINIDNDDPNEIFINDPNEIDINDPNEIHLEPPSKKSRQ